MKGLLLNSTTFNEKSYTYADTQKFYATSKFGIEDGFYGGRVDRLAGTKHTKDKSLYMCISKDKTIDLFIANPIKLNVSDLKEIAKGKRISIEEGALKNDILKALGVETKEEGEK